MQRVDWGFLPLPLLLDRSRRLLIRGWNHTPTGPIQFLQIGLNLEIRHRPGFCLSPTTLRSHQDGQFSPITSAEPGLNLLRL